jgi:proteasome lid subunit RPN8/RPN11
MHAPRQLILPSSVRAQILNAAQATPDVEVCGLLTGRGDGDVTVTAAHPVRNIASTPANRFEIDPQDQFNILRRARADGLRVVGHYHSHPNGRAKPSTYDLAMAADADAVWCIVGLNPTQLRAFVCVDPAQGFAAIPIIEAG